MRPSSNREFENHFSAPFPCDVRADAIRIVFLDSAESFIPCTVLRTARAGRSAEDRLLCKQEALGSNPSRSTPKVALQLSASGAVLKDSFALARLEDYRKVALRAPAPRQWHEVVK